MSEEVLCYAVTGKLCQIQIAIHYLEAFIKAIKASVSFHEEGYVLALVFLPCYFLWIQRSHSTSDLQGRRSTLSECSTKKIYPWHKCYHLTTCLMWHVGPLRLTVITGSEINFFRQARTGNWNFFSVATWKNVVAKECQ